MLSIGLWIYTYANSNGEKMTEETVSNMIAGLPNFAGFTLLSWFLFSALKQSMETNAKLSDRLIECYRDRSLVSRDKSEE